MSDILPPPPPPPPPAAPPAPAASPVAAGGVAAIFAELNRGEEVTKGLRKVDKSEMTHKNPALRAGGTVPSSAGSAGEAMEGCVPQNALTTCLCSGPQAANKAKQTTSLSRQEAS